MRTVTRTAAAEKLKETSYSFCKEDAKAIAIENEILEQQLLFKPPIKSMPPYAAWGPGQNDNLERTSHRLQQTAPI